MKNNTFLFYSTFFVAFFLPMVVFSMELNKESLDPSTWDENLNDENSPLPTPTTAELLCMDGIEENAAKKKEIEKQLNLDFGSLKNFNKRSAQNNALRIGTLQNNQNTILNNLNELRTLKQETINYANNMQNRLDDNKKTITFLLFSLNTKKTDINLEQLNCPESIKNQLDDLPERLQKETQYIVNFQKQLEKENKNVQQELQREEMRLAEIFSVLQQGVLKIVNPQEPEHKEEKLSKTPEKQQEKKENENDYNLITDAHLSTHTITYVQEIRQEWQESVANELQKHENIITEAQAVLNTPIASVQILQEERFKKLEQKIDAINRKLPEKNEAATLKTVNEIKDTLVSICPKVNFIRQKVADALPVNGKVLSAQEFENTTKSFGYKLNNIFRNTFGGILRKKKVLASLAVGVAAYSYVKADSVIHGCINSFGSLFNSSMPFSCPTWTKWW